jgi:hypothetical protein
MIMSVFRLDIITFLSLIEESRQSGSASSILPGGVLGQREQSRAVIRFVAGKVSESYIEYMNGQIYRLNDNSLRHLLVPLRTLEWHLETSSDPRRPPDNKNSIREPAPGSPPTRAFLPTHRSRIIPYTTRRVTPDLVRQLSHRQRKVLLLIDGVKSIEQINALAFPTNPNLQMITEVLNELEGLNLIVMTRGQG